MQPCLRRPPDQQRVVAERPRKGAFQFVQISSPRDLAAHQHRVRSHAAKNSLARQKRVREHLRSRMGEITSQGARDAQSPEEDAKRESPEVGSPVTILGSARSDPFQTYCRPITPFEHFLVDHLINYVIIYPDTSPADDALGEGLFRRQVAHERARATAEDPGVLAAGLLTACRSLVCLGASGPYNIFALQYRAETLAFLQKKIANGDVGEETLTQTLVLIAEAGLVGEEVAMQQHLKAMTTMIRLRGGLHSLSMGGIFGKVAEWYAQNPRRRGQTLMSPPLVASICNVVAGFLQDYPLDALVLEGNQTGETCNGSDSC